MHGSGAARRSSFADLPTFPRSSCAVKLPVYTVHVHNLPFKNTRLLSISSSKPKRATDKKYEHDSGLGSHDSHISDFRRHFSSKFKWSKASSDP